MLLTFRPELNEVYQGSVNFQPKEVFGLVEKHEIAHMKAGSQEKGKQARNQRYPDIVPTPRSRVQLPQD